MRNALIFDDNKILAELVQLKVEALFRKYDLEFEVDRMNSIKQLESCEKTYQLVFMDIVLPEQDGINITREWKNSGRFGEVVFVSEKITWMRIWSRQSFPIKERLLRHR